MFIFFTVSIICILYLLVKNQESYKNYISPLMVQGFELSLDISDKLESWIM